MIVSVGSVAVLLLLAAAPSEAFAPLATSIAKTTAFGVVRQVRRDVVPIVESISRLFDG